MADVFERFDEWAAGLARGEHPDPREYLAGLGAAEQDELRRLMDAHLLALPRPEPSEEAVAATAAWIAGKAPLVALRTRRGLRRAQVVDAIVEAHGLRPADAARVGQHYHRLENGLLDPGRVARSVWGVLDRLLAVDTRSLATLRPLQPKPAAAAYFRADAFVAPAEVAPAAGDAEPDEVDRLFGLA